MICKFKLLATDGISNFGVRQKKSALLWYYVIEVRKGRGEKTKISENSCSLYSSLHHNVLDVLGVLL